MLAADVLGVAIESIDLVQGDTAVVKSGGGTGGSRSLQTGGLAVRDAARALVEQARSLAAARLGCQAEHVVFDPARGIFDRADARDGAPDDDRSPDSTSDARGDDRRAGLGWAELTAEAGPLRAEATYSPASGGTAASGAHLAVVEVDTQMGRVELIRVVAVDDAGDDLNPLLAEGQVHGVLAQGIGQALCEEVRYTSDVTAAPRPGLVRGRRRAAAALRDRRVAYRARPTLWASRASVSRARPA